MKIRRIEFGRTHGQWGWGREYCPAGCIIWGFGPVYLTWLADECI